MTGDGRSAVGGLVVLTGYGDERLGYLAGLLGETLPNAVWAVPELRDRGREIQLAGSHLKAGMTVVLVAERGQVRSFEDLAERVGARFLHVISTPPSALGSQREQPAAPGAAPAAPAQGVFVHAGASLAAQLGVVLSSWNRLGDTS